MNTLVAVGTGAAFLCSLAASFAPASFITRRLAPDVYHEALIFTIARTLIGNSLVARSKRQTSKALRALADLTPTARSGRG
jgi:Cu+-exporting ATPase